MSGTDDEFKLQIAQHMGAVNEKLVTVVNGLHEVKKEQKEARNHNDKVVKELQVHNDKVVKELQQHFDGKLSECNEEVMNILNDRHLDKTEVRGEITKAIKASEKRIRKYFGYFLLAVGTIFGFIYTYFEPISNFISNLKGN